MPAKYSVIQYIPDPIADERINIGLVVFDKDTIRVHFLTNWERVRQFANQDITFLKAFADELSEAASTDLLLPGFERYPQLNNEFLTKIIGNWINTIQFTEPRGSLKEIDDLVNYVASRFLMEPVRTKRDYRDKRTAANIAKVSIRKALTERVGGEEAEGLLNTQAAIQGKRQIHTFDAVVSNAVPYLAISAISFELPEARILPLQTKALAWSIADVHENDPNFPIGIMTLPPREDLESYRQLVDLYKQTTKVYKGLHASILTEENIDDWAYRVVQHVPV